MRADQKHWTSEEDATLMALSRTGRSDDQISLILNITNAQVRYRRRALSKGIRYIQDSPYPVYNSPLEMEGDALVLPDVELPYHNADFLNDVLGLAERWNIRKCIVAGDLLHFNSLSSWEPPWMEKTTSGITDAQEKVLLDFAMTLPDKYQQSLIEVAMDLDRSTENSDKNLSSELSVVRSVIVRLEDRFDEIHFILGNHEGRFLRALESALLPSELLNLVTAGKAWKIAPYYYSYLNSGGERFLIEHPKNAAKTTAVKLASKHQCNILMGHSHRLSQEWDPSGKYYAIHMGCIVDENRLPYVAQRHNTADTHKLGAVIVRDGFPWLLYEGHPLLFQEEP
jgi:hypothetical protein